METNKIEPYQDKEHQKEQAYLRAKKRVKELKGFYWHAFWYVAVNIFIVTVIVSNGGDLFHFGTYSTALFWGIGLGFHAIGVFGKNLLFNKNWEERKIKEFMDSDKTKWN
ncbi:2TM domain-containing protein [uncultured Algibacter sp.]|uniref:2TM domain-containing protein n=1 Tax=uncultured Algibacter sp. TaxID=298659 RepID=UPI00261FCEC9|nr:2TM domain-containing protein [uncultured Algibacter sp.]